MGTPEKIRIIVRAIAEKKAITRQNWPITITYNEEFKRNSITEDDLDRIMEKLCKEDEVFTVTNRPHRMAYRQWDDDPDSTLAGGDLGCYNVWAGDPFDEFARLCAGQDQKQATEPKTAGDPRLGEDEGQTAKEQGPEDKTGGQAGTAEDKRLDARPSTDSHDQRQNYFVYEHDHWDIGFQGATNPHVQDLKGLWYIAHLLDNPNQEFSARFLSQLVNKPVMVGKTDNATLKIYKEMTAEQLEEEGLTISDCGPVKKKRYPKELEEAARDFEEARNDNDPLVRQEGKDRWDAAVDKHMRKQGHNMPVDSSDEERARKNTQRAIERAYSRMSENGLDALVSHLKGRITTGGKCSYTSHPENVDWKVNAP